MRRALLLGPMAAIVLAAAAAAAHAPRAHFDAARAYRWVARQVAFGPRPAGSPASRQLAAELRATLPHGRFEAVPGGLRNVVGEVRGRDPRSYVVVGAHYDTKDIPGFVGANDGAAGTADVLELARALRPGEARPTVYFVLFDGEESPAGAPDTLDGFLTYGLRGSKVAARHFRHARAMILLDLIGQRDVSFPREGFSSWALWARLRRAARGVRALRAFPAHPATYTAYDDHLPFERQGIPAIDLIDFDFACLHRACDDLAGISRRSLGLSGSAVLALLRALPS